MQVFKVLNSLKFREFCLLVLSTSLLLAYFLNDSLIAFKKELLKTHENKFLRLRQESLKKTTLKPLKLENSYKNLKELKLKIKEIQDKYKENFKHSYTGKSTQLKSFLGKAGDFEYSLKALSKDLGESRLLHEVSLEFTSDFSGLCKVLEALFKERKVFYLKEASFAKENGKISTKMLILFLSKQNLR